MVTMEYPGWKPMIHGAIEKGRWIFLGFHVFLGTFFRRSHSHKEQPEAFVEEEQVGGVGTSSLELQVGLYGEAWSLL